MTWWWAGVLVSLVSAACTAPNPAYCESSDECNNGYVCNLETHGCEVMHDASIDAPPACTLDDECASGVCRADGACEDAANVLYVAPDGLSGGACSADARCELTYALAQTTETRSIVRLAAGTYVSAGDIVIGSDRPDLTIVGGRAAVLQRPATGPMFDIRGAAANAGPTVTLRGFTLHKGVACTDAALVVDNVVMDQPPVEVRPWLEGMRCPMTVTGSELRNSAADGINIGYGDLTVIGTTVTTSKGIGIVASPAAKTVHVERSRIESSQKQGLLVHSATMLTVTRTFFTKNIFGALVSLGTRYDVTNKMVYENGGMADDNNNHLGGMRLESTNGGQVSHNTIVGNNAIPNAIYSGGLHCDGGGSARNNIIVGNWRGNGKYPYANTRGNCDFTGSIIQESTVPLAFVNYNDLHIGSASVARNAAGIASVAVDFDGDPRSDGAADVGADEYVPTN